MTAFSAHGVFLVLWLVIDFFQVCRLEVRTLVLVADMSSVTSCAAGVLFTDASFPVSSFTATAVENNGVSMPDGPEALLLVLVETGFLLMMPKFSEALELFGENPTAATV